MKKFLTIMTVALFGLASCANDAKNKENNQDEIANQQTTTTPEPENVDCLNGLEFLLTELNGTALKAIDKEILPQIVFFDGEAKATVGCNSIFANYDLGKNNTITFSNMGSTKKACLEESREDEFFEAFNKTAQYALTETEITLSDTEGNVLYKGMRQ